MSRLIWDAVGEKFYEMGTKMGVLYPMNNTGAYDKGVAWNGLTAVTESPSGAEETKLYADDIKYASLRSAEEYGYTIEAYTYPTEWEPCDGSAQVATGVSIGQQKRQGFGFSWVTTVGNDVDDEAVDYSKDKVDGSHTEDLSGLVEQIEEARNRLNVRITKEMLMFEKEKLLAVSMILSIGNCGGKTANVQRVLLDYYVHHVDYKDIAGQMGYSKRSVERLSRQGVREIQAIIDSSKLNSLEKIFT